MQLSTNILKQTFNELLKAGYLCFAEFGKRCYSLYKVTNSMEFNKVGVDS